MRSVSRNFGLIKRGQIARPVVVTEIQTGCNFKANLRDRHYLLGWVHCLFSSVVLESRDNLVVWYHSNISVSGLTAVFSYTKIFFNLRHHQNQVQDYAQQPNPANQLNIARYKKAVSTAIWLQLTLVACYLPYGVVTALQAKSGVSSSFFYARIYTATLVFLNSSLNPILYCWKLDEVRQTVKDTIRQVRCLCFSSSLLQANMVKS